MTICRSLNSHREPGVAALHDQRDELTITSTSNPPPVPELLNIDLVWLLSPIFTGACSNCRFLFSHLVL